MNLKKYVRDTTVYSKENNAYICDQLLRGLTEMHKAGIYHFDIKPENIMITINNNKVEKVKYIDFGSSCNKINIDRIINNKYIDDDIFLENKTEVIKYNENIIK